MTNTVKAAKVLEWFVTGYNVPSLINSTVQAADWWREPANRMSKISPIRVVVFNTLQMDSLSFNTTVKCTQILHTAVR